MRPIKEFTNIPIENTEQMGQKAHMTVAFQLANNISIIVGPPASVELANAFNWFTPDQLVEPFKSGHKVTLIFE